MCGGMKQDLLFCMKCLVLWVRNKTTTKQKKNNKPQPSSLFTKPKHTDLWDNGFSNWTVKSCDRVFQSSLFSQCKLSIGTHLQLWVDEKRKLETSFCQTWKIICSFRFVLLLLQSVFPSCCGNFFCFVFVLLSGWLGLLLSDNLWYQMTTMDEVKPVVKTLAKAIQLSVLFLLCLSLNIFSHMIWLVKQKKCCGNVPNNPSQFHQKKNTTSSKQQNKNKFINPKLKQNCFSQTRLTPMFIVFTVTQRNLITPDHHLSGLLKKLQVGWRKWLSFQNMWVLFVSKEWTVVVWQCFVQLKQVKMMQRVGLQKLGVKTIGDMMTLLEEIKKTFGEE